MLQLIIFYFPRQSNDLDRTGTLQHSMLVVLLQNLWKTNTIFVLITTFFLN
uniref:Uncharacterized protein n=1 Tax=Rhizophora mucronata TaxID=61149 RepID=A0A2P2KJ95_RHIMU